MAEPLPKIDWGDTTNGDVQAYLDANPPRFSSQWWHNFLFVDDIAAPLQEQLHLGDDPAGDAAKAAAAAAAQAAADAAQAAGNAAAGTWPKLAPYVAVGALALLAFQVARSQ